MKAILRSGFLALVIVALAVPANAGPLEDSVAAYQRGDYATALKIIRPFAEQGDADAQFGLGYMYDEGQGVPQDDAEAAKWYLKAAEQGNAGAQYNLGFMHAKGEGVRQGYVEAAKWFLKAAEQGRAGSQNMLGVMYMSGRGVPQDDAEAQMWFILAAAQGHKNAQKNREIMAKRMTPDQIAEAQRLARDWMAKHQQ